MRVTTKCSSVLFCVILVLLYDTDITSASAAPTCNLGCKQSGGDLLHFQEGVTYTYNLDGNTETLVPKSKGPYGDSVRVGVKAKVEVAALPDCKVIIRLKNVHITGPDSKKYANTAKLEEHPLVVSLHGGKLDSEVCADPHDDYTSLNIKRAVASLFQANTKEKGGSSDEVDVFGGCHTNFRVTKQKEFTVIKKRKDLNDCKYREGLRQDFFVASHGHSSKFQSTPLLDSDYEVELKIKNKVLEVATAKESYLFRPFANRDNGARTNVYTKLTLESSGNVPLPAITNSQPRSIIFENPHEVVTSNSQAVLQALHRLDDSLHGSVPSTAGKDFGTLVKLVRHASKEDLLSIYGNAKVGAGFMNKEDVKKIFTDALFRARSADSIAAAVELLKNHEIEGRMAKLWYLSFAFVRHTSASALAAATTLLDEADLPYEAYYGIGAMAGQYCREHVCEKVPEFEGLLSRLAKVVVNPSKGNKQKENTVIAALKGLKNVKHLTDEAANKVANIIKDPHVQTRVRVAALETAQSDPCRNKFQRIAFDLFSNREEDSELRIKAYLVVAECPTPKTATKLSEFLETEPVNQVGAFVTSHLRNLRAGSNPDKEHAREILYDVRPKKKFPIDFRKFSQNYDFSYNFDAISTSAAAEANVIFSQKSYIPRSVSLNLTTEVFGHAFNIFELNGRAENLESIVEKYFGPKGYFQTHKPEDLYKEGKHHYQTLVNHIQDKYRSMIRHKRSVTRDETNYFAQKVRLFNNDMDNTLDIDLSLKVLGNELVWLNFDERDEPQAATTIMDKLSAMYEREVKNVKEFKHDIKEHFQLLDSELSYPTATGLPLRLRAVGSGVFHMKLGGKFDLAAFMKDPKSGDAHLEIIPSASIDIHGEMTIDGYAVEAGVKVAANLHTATGSDISLKLLDGHGFDLNFRLPVKNSDVLTASTEVLTTIKEMGLASADHLLEFQVPRSDYSGCFDQLDQFVGVIFCGDIGFPLDKEPLISNAALYPLNGHSKVSLRFVKEDESLQSYQLKLYFNIDDPHRKTLEVKFDTPGSKRPREISFKASAVTHPNKAINIELMSPVHRFAVRGEMIDTDTEHTLSGSLVLSDAIEYRARVGLLIEGSTYRPILEYTPVGSNAPNIQVDGSVNVDKKPGSEYRRYTFNNVKFVVENKGTFSINGVVTKDTNLIGSDVTVGYDAHTVGIKTRLQKLAPGSYKINAEINPSQYPDLAFSVKYDFMKDDKHLENNLVLIHGPDLNSQELKLTVFQQLHYQVESLTNFDISTKNSISYPALNLEGQLDGAVTRKSLSYNFVLGYQQNKFKSKLNAKTGINQFGDYEVDFFVAAFDREVAVQAKREITGTNKSKFYNKLEISPNRNYEVSANVLHQLTPNDIHFTIDAVARIYNVPNEYRLDAGVKSNPSMFTGHALITVGQDQVMNGELHFTKTSEPSGNFKITLLRVLDANGEYRLAQGRGAGSMIINMPELRRTIKGTADLSHSGPRHTGVIDIFYDFERDSNKKLHIETDTHLTRTEINSKNNILLDGKNLQINFNGECHGKGTNGDVNVGYEVTLPDGQHFIGKLRESMKLLPQAAHAELFVEMARSEKPGAPLSKIFLDTYAKNVDIRSYAGQFKFAAGKECPEGTILYSNTLNSVPVDGKLAIDHESVISGSEVKYPFNTKTHATVSKAEIIYDTIATVGEYSMKSNGKVLTGLEDGIRHVEFVTDIKTTVEGAQNIRLQHLYHFVPGHGEKPCSCKLSQNLMVNEKHYEFGCEAELHSKRGMAKSHLKLPQYAEPSTAQLQYTHEFADNKYRSDVTFNGRFDQGKTASINVLSEYDKDLEFINTHLSGHLPVETFKNIDLKVDHKKLSSLSRHTDISLTVNDKVMDGFVKYDFSQHHPMIDVSFTHSGGKSRFFYKLEKTGNRQATSEGLVMWTRNGGGQLEFSSKSDLESFENFYILLKVHSEKLNINNLKFEVANKPSKSGAGKKISILAQTADKPGISGSVSYKLKENESGFVVEGKGTIEMDNEKLPVTYKATLKRLVSTVDKETGTSFILNANFNKGSFIFEHKFTDKEFHYNSKFCKETKCAHFEAASKIELSDTLELNQDSFLSYENTFMDRNDNYKLFSRTKRKGLFFDHETGFTNKDRKYLIKSFFHEAEAAFMIILPSREIIAAANFEVPMLTKPKSNHPNTLQFRFDGSLYLDKLRNPGDVANLIIFADLTTASKSANAVGEIKLKHPKLHKDLTVKAKGAVGLEGRLVDTSVEIDIFNRENQMIAGSFVLDHIRTEDSHKVTSALEFTSGGLRLNVGVNGYAFVNKEGFGTSLFGFYTDKQNVRKEVGAMVEAQKTHFTTLVKVPNRELLKVNLKMQLSKSNQLIEGEASIAEIAHYAGKVDVQGFSSARAVAHRKDNVDNRAEGKILLSPSEFLIQADHVHGPQSDNLFTVHLKLQDPQPGEPSLRYNSEHIKLLLQKLKEEKDSLISGVQPVLRETIHEIQKDFKEGLDIFKTAQPDYRPLMESYKGEFQAITRELSEDPEFRALAEVVQTLIKGMMNIIQQQTERFIALHEKLSSEFHELQERAVRAYQEIVPSLLKASEQVFESWLHVFNEVLNYAHKLLRHVLDLMKDAEPEIRKLAENFSVYFRDLVKAVSEIYETVRHEVEHWFERALREIKDLPVYSMVEENLKNFMNFELPPQFWSFYEELVFALEDILPTVELKNFVKIVFSYVEKKLKRENVNDAAELRDIAETASLALQSVIGDIREQYLAGRPAAGILGLNIPITWPSLIFRLPDIGSIKDSSLVRYLKAITELPTITDLFYTYRPTLNPIDYIPPYDGYAMILRSHHFFTFDKRHYAFQGSCSYVLAQDFLDGNFSVVANLDNGMLKSITVNDHTDSVELFSDNTVTVNGKHGDYPFDVNDMSGWVRFGAINFNHKAGIKIRKILKQDLITIKVSGFYFWRTRGLLGTINNEHYDDFMLPDGHISNDAAEFVNSYRVRDACPPAAEMKGPGAHTPECDKFFGGSSTMRIAFNFLKPDIYREACDQHVAVAPGDKTEAACEIVAAYVMALKKADYLLASLPIECVKCKVANEYLEYGHSVPVTSPAGKADIVFVVEQSSHNEPVFNELVKPLMGTLRNDLAAKGLGDVEFVVIGYGGPKQKHPRIYGNNGKVTFEGNSENLFFGDTEKLRPPYDSVEKKIRYVIHYLNVELGKEQIVSAMNEANIYPFRQGAAKIIILVNSSPCEKSATYPFSLQVPRTLYVRNFYKEHGLNFFIISPLSTLTVSNNPNDRLKNIVGFDNEEIYTVDGSKPDRKDLVHFNDLCIDFSQYYGGAAFSSQNFIESSPESKQRFIGLVSNRVTKGAAAHEYKEECTCNLYHGIFAYPECKVTSQEKRP
ncbi:UNVERIFIED_CONTAM: hypothetical protein PYX00_004970 [Menopon gallinae]|uniref:Apolipophorin n=1 Tax=Menopon gallinae TaxID=328185 RepID=A0AAW2I807_9NEOP